MPKFVQGYKPDNSDIVYSTYEEALRVENEVRAEQSTQTTYVIRYYDYPFVTLDAEYVKITYE